MSEIAVKQSQAVLPDPKAFPLLQRTYVEIVWNTFARSKNASLRLLISVFHSLDKLLSMASGLKLLGKSSIVTIVHWNYRCELSFIRKYTWATDVCEGRYHRLNNTLELIRGKTDKKTFSSFDIIFCISRLLIGCMMKDYFGWFDHLNSEAKNDSEEPLHRYIVCQCQPNLWTILIANIKKRNQLVSVSQ